MVAPVRYLSRRDLQNKIGILDFSEDTTVLEVVGRVGIGSTIFDADYNLDVRGEAFIQDLTIGELSVDNANFDSLIVTGVSTFISSVFANNDVYIGRNLDVTSGRTDLDVLTVTGISTFSSNISINGDADVSGKVIVGSGLSVTGISTFLSAVNIRDDVTITGFTEVDDFRALGPSIFNADVDINAPIEITGRIDAYSFANFTNSINVDGQTELDNLNVSGVSSFLNAVNVVSSIDVSDDLRVSGISTFLNSIDADGDLDVDGLTSLDVLNVSELATFSSDIDANGNLDVEGHTELDDLNVSGFSTFASNLDINASVDIAGYLNVDGHTELDDLNVSGVSTFLSNLDIDGSIDVDGHTELDDLSVSGVSTFLSDVNILGNTELSNNLIISGVSTFISTVYTSSDLEVSGYLDVDGHTELDTLNVSGVSTFAGTADFNGDIDVDGNTELDNLNVSGVSTFASDVDINSSVNISNNLVVGSGLTVSGVSTFASNVKIQGELHGPEEFIIDPSAVGDNTGLVRIKGDLYVDGTEFIVNSTTIELADFKVGIATTVGTNLLLDGAGIGIGSTNIEKTFTYNNSSNTLESSIGLGVTSGGEFKTGTDSVLNRTTLGPTVLNSSLTSLGTLNSLNVSGVSTFSSNVNISDNLVVGSGLSITGISTFTSNVDVNSSVDISDNLVVGSGLTVSGVSTFAGTADFNGDIDVDGHTELDNLNVSGVSTFAGIADFNGDIDVDGHTELDTLNVSIAATIANLTLENIGIAVTAILDEDDMISNRDDALATQQSIKAYVDSRPDPDLRFAGNIGIGTIDIDNDTFNIIGITNEIETVGSGITLTIGLPDNVFITTSLTVGTATTINDSGIIAGIITGTLDNTLTLNTSGIGITGFATYNNSGVSTFTVTSNATDLNTAETIVSRDGSGNFSAGTITADLTGTATTATQLETPRTFQITGDVFASPISFDGTGNVSLAATIQPNSVGLGTDTFGNYVATIEDSGNSDIDVSNSGTETAPVTLGLTTTGVVPGTYGSSIDIPTFTVDSRGRLTFADTFAVGVALTVSGDSGTETIGLLSETLTISGGTNLNSSASLNTVTINLDNNISLTSVNATGVITASNFVGDLTGNADTATQLETPRTFEITGDVLASPVSFNGSGNVSLAATIQPNSVELGTDTFGDYVATIADSGDSDIVVNNSGTETAAVTLGLTTTGITAGTYGSSTQIPTFTVDSRGRLTSASVVQSVGAALTVAGDSGTETIDLSTEILTISGGTNLTSSAASDTITIDLDNDISVTSIGVSDINATGIVTATGGFVGDLTGTATTATQLETPRTFEITGDVLASPVSFDGTGNVSLAATIQPNSVGLGTDTFGDYVATIADSGDSDIVVNNSGTETAAVTLGLTTTGVTAGTYGSSIDIPTFTVDSRGRLTSVGSTFVGVALTVSGDSGTETINFLNETLTISGGTNLTSSAASDTITIDLDNDISVTSIGVSDINATGIVTATEGFIGDLTGTATTATNLADAANITTGTIDDARLPDLITSNININSGVSTFSIVNATLFVGNLTGIASTATQLETPRTFQITGDVLASPVSFDGTSNVSLAATIQPNSVELGTDTFGDYVETVSGTIGEIVVTGGTGESSNPVISISPNPTLPGNTTVTGNLQVDGSVNVDGNITVGGTSGFIIVQNFRVSDANLVLGFTTDNSGNEVSTDITANSGGISIASTEGNPLVLLDTDENFDYNYKNILWYQAGSFAGLNTDAWLINYAVGIGSTQFPSGTRLAAGSVQFTEDDLAVVRNIDASGIVTATNFVGNLTGTASTASFATTAFTLNGTLEQDLSVAFAQTSTNLLGGVAGNVPYQSATDTTTFVSNGAAGQVLLFNGSIPVWSDVSAASNAFTGISVYDEGVLVGFSQGITALNFVSPNLTAVGPNTTGIATITLSDDLTVGFATFSGDVSVGSSITMDATTGIISAVAFYGSGENLIDVIAAKIDGIDINEEGTLVNDQVTTINFVGDYVTATTGLTTTSVDVTFTTPPYADNSGVSTSVIGGIGSITSLTVSGVSTFSSIIDANGDLDVDGHTELDNLNVSGIATFVSIETTSDVSIGSSLFVSGITTSTGGFVGNLTGTATTATQLETPRTFQITGDVLASPVSFDGSGNVSLAATIQPNSVELGTDTFGNYVATIADSGDSDVVVNNSGTETAAITLGLTTTGVSAGSYGSSIEIPTFTVDSRGRLTSAGTTTISNVGAALTVAGDSGTEIINLGLETLTISGGTNLTSSAASDTVTINLDDSISLTGVNATGVITANTFNGDLTGTATTATQLETPRTFEITGDVLASPISFDGTGNVSFAATIQPNSVELGTDTFGNYVATIADSGNTDLVVNNSGTETAAITLGLTTTGVSAGSYGSSTEIPTFTVDSRGRLTVANSVQVGVALTISGDTGTETINFLNETLTITGGTNLTSSAASDTVTINLDDSISLTGVNATGVITATTFNGDLTGNADTATALETARDFSISGDATASSISFDGTANVGLALTLATVNSNVGTFGSQTQIPVVTVNSKGLVTAVSTASVGSALTVSGDSGSETINLVSETLTISGGTNLTSSAASDTITINLDDSISLTGVNATGVITATEFKTGATGSAIGITTNTISGPAVLNIDPAGVGDNTGLVVIKGDLQVDGTETIINSTTVTINDKNIQIADGAINDAAADGAGITVNSGDGDKTFQFVDVDDSFRANINLDVTSGNVYKIGGTEVLSSTTLGSGVVNSSLTSVGTLGQLNVTGIVTAFSFDGDLSGNATTATRLATARVIGLGGDLSGSANFDGSSNITISATIQPNSVALGNDTVGSYVATIADSGNTDLVVNNSGTETAAITLGLTGTGVTAGSYGSSTQISSFTVDSRGRLTAANSFPVGVALTVSGDTGTETINFLNETLTIAGGTNLTSSAASDTVTINLDDYISLTGVNATGVVTASSFDGDLTGNANTATTLETSRTFEITGDIIASPISFNGSGNVSLAATIQPNSVGLGTDTFGDYVATIADSGDSDIVVNNSGTETAAVTLGLTTTGVTAGTYGSALQIPTFTVDSRGRLTAIGVSDIQTGTGVSLTVSGDSGTEIIDLGTETLTISGGTNLTSSAASDTVTINLDDYISLTGVNATGVVTATSFDGNASTATALQTGRTITLSGDVSGSATFDGTSNITITSTVADDSHDHTIANIDGLQGEIDAKLDAIDYNASDILTKLLTVDGSGSGLDADLLDGLDSTYFLNTSSTAQTKSGDLRIGGSSYNIAIGINNTQSSGTIGRTATYNEGIFWHTSNTEYGIYRTSGAWTPSNYQQLKLNWPTGIELDGGTAYGKSGVNISSGDFKVGGTTVINSSRQLNNVTYQGNTIWHAGNDGSGSTLDADLLDGQQGSYYRDASNINAGTIDDAYLPATISSNITGNAATATRLVTARTISLGGDLSGSTSFNGSSNVTISATIQPNSVELGNDTTGNYVATIADAGNSNITVANSGTETAAVTLDLTNTTVSAGSYGSSTQVPTFTVDSKGRLTAAGSVAVSTPTAILSVAGDTGTESIDLGTETLTISGGTNLTSSAASNTVILNLDNNISVTSVSATGTISASSFTGDGSNLTGIGITIFNTSTANTNYYPLFTDSSTGSVSTVGVSAAKLTYNPADGELTAVNFNSTSDENLKTNVHTVENPLSIIENIRGVSFDWKETGKASYGVIAQEIEKVLPELVNQSDIKSVNYNGLIAVLIESIKELKNEIEELKKSN